MTLRELDKSINQTYHVFYEGIRLNEIFNREDAMRLYGDCKVKSIEHGCYETYLEIEKQ